MVNQAEIVRVDKIENLPKKLAQHFCFFVVKLSKDYFKEVGILLLL